MLDYLREGDEPLEYEGSAMILLQLIEIASPIAYCLPTILNHKNSLSKL